MRDKNTTQQANRLTPSAKARIVANLRRGDKVLVAEVTHSTSYYVKKVLAQKRSDKSRLARRIWLTANRLTIDRSRMKGDLGA